MIEFDRITTRGGDRGESSLFNGERRRKDDLLFDAMGDVDEANVSIGVARAHLQNEQTKRLLHDLQQVLFKIGAQIATPPNDALYGQIKHVVQEDIDELETIQKRLMDRIEIGPVFVTPGDSMAGALIDVSRTVVRRAERTIVACIRDRHMNHLVLCQNYLNRLSDYLFVLARGADQNIVS
ncbi:MAG TPA: cob(I)yrinic acid a,c-diamide adenosyltransferase [Spirochaetia bacterium]|nr:cob(I)yrinic acid a,c-diamide adenosyltransferase [Spirochaetia bacterium]